MTWPLDIRRDRYGFVVGVRLDLQAGKHPADLKHRDKAFEKFSNARERSGDRQRSKRWPNMNLWFLINPRRASLRRPTAGLEIPLKPPTLAIMFCSAVQQGEMLGTVLLLCSSGAEAAAATKTELIPVTFPNRANYQSRSLNHLAAPGPHMQYTCRQ